MFVSKLEFAQHKRQVNRIIQCVVKPLALAMGI